MMKRGNPRSGLGGGPSRGVGGQRLAPRLGRLHGVHVGFGALGVRNLLHKLMHTKPTPQTHAYKTFNRSSTKISRRHISRRN
ncbi:hypothetical protein EYY89_12545 [Hafnia paralvei]|uniref:Uncharacterized protein n=1 Tax=Hafnia paralvei TaxID=546367 RepID=A0A4Q9EMN6_9GAMM|nr:hypothetical protein EYY89_12545 [Hafnia paralvei]